MTLIVQIHGGHQASQRTLIMRKKTSEIDYINGEIALLARSIGLNAPLNSKVVDMIHDIEQLDTCTRKFADT